MKFINSRFFLLAAVTFLSACASLDKLNRQPTAMPSLNVEVQQDVVLPTYFSTSDKNFWRYVQKGRNNGSTVRDLTMHFLTANGTYSGDWCQIQTATDKGVSQPSLKAGRYSVNPEENIYDKNGKFDFKTIEFNINDFQVSCFLKNPRSNIEDVKALLNPTIIIN